MAKVTFKVLSEPVCLEPRIRTYMRRSPVISDRNYEHYRTITFNEEYVSLLNALHVILLSSALIWSMNMKKMECKRIVRGSVFSNWGYTYKYEIQEWMGDKDIIPDSMPNTPERKVAMCIPQDTVLWSTVCSTCSIYEYFHHIWLIMKEIEVEMSWDFEHILFKYLWVNEDHERQKADNF